MRGGGEEGIPRRGGEEKRSSQTIACCLKDSKKRRRRAIQKKRGVSSRGREGIPRSCFRKTIGPEGRRRGGKVASKTSRERFLNERSKAQRER